MKSSRTLINDLLNNKDVDVLTVFINELTICNVSRTGQQKLTRWTLSKD